MVRNELVRLGQGGWHLGDDPSREKIEIKSLQLGVKLGMTLIDTAEMYGDGRSETLIGRAIKPFPRSAYQLVSKVLPHNAGRKRIFASCNASLSRLGTDYLDVYLLHWRGDVPLSETIECMEELVAQGKILCWGVSNFDTPDMEELWSTQGGQNCAVNQVLYHLGSRGIEYDLLGWLHTHNVMAMAYCPLAQAGRLRRLRPDFWKNKTLADIAAKYNASIAQLLLAFTLRDSNVIAIPKSSSPAHTRENAGAITLRISNEDWRAIDQIYQPPTCKMHLDIE
ncbi:aldo/keto reductase [Clostridia bacterium]|nr:aldo/keto reductase [Clostridia bacterium]